MLRSPTKLGPTDSVWAGIDATLRLRHVPLTFRNELRSKLTGKFDGLLLYGSWARGDAGEHSDLDTLVLNLRGNRPAPEGHVSVADYDEVELRAASGTLFGYHLVRDGLILVERSGCLSRILATIEPPAPGAVTERVRSLTPVLDVSTDDREKYISGLTKVARYLLRSALYAEALDHGEPCFSVREIAQRKNDAQLAAVLSSHELIRPAADSTVFNHLCDNLGKVVGPLLPNSYGDLHGLIEGAWADNQELSNFATLALSDGKDELPYDELPKVTL